jgi:hypothetical protein
VRRRLRALAACAALLAGGSGCSSFLPGLLPDDRREIASSWSSFEEAREAFDRIVANETTVDQLRDLGFHPDVSPNVRILTYVDVYERFVPNSGIRLDDQDPGVRECVSARERCNGWELEVYQRRSKREGNVLLDWFTFRRETDTSGWNFRSLIVVVDDRVAYKLLDGNPSEASHVASVRPLGPLQDIFFAVNLALRVLF